jgi:hypothetical protein
MSIERTAKQYLDVWNQRDPEVRVIVLEGGKIRQVVGFLDKAPKGVA